MKMISYNPRAFLQTWCLRKSCRSPETDISHSTGVLDVKIGLTGGKNLKKKNDHIFHRYCHFTNSMEQCHSWEADRCSASHEMPRILWNPKVHYHAHNIRQLVPVLTQTNSVLNSTFHCFTTHFNIISPSMSSSSKRSLSFTVLHQNLVRILISPMHATLPTHLTFLELIIQLKSGWRCKSWKILVTQFSPVSYHYPPGHTFFSVLASHAFFPQDERPYWKRKCQWRWI